MSVATDFRAFLANEPTIKAHVDGRVCQAFVDQTDRVPYILFRRSGKSDDSTLAGEVSLTTTQFDVEVRGETLDQAEDIADEVSRVLDAKQNTWNGRRIQGSFVNDQSDDYERMPPASADDPEHVVALIVQVYNE